jgi:hypothetical protein
VWVVIHNHSESAVFSLELLEVDVVDQPELRWRINPRVSNTRTQRDVLAPGDEGARFPVTFSDETGTDIRPKVGAAVAVTFTFVDAAGLRWRRRDNLEPERI